MVPLICHIYRQLVEKGQVANICTSALFLRRGKYPQVTNVGLIYQSRERDEMFTGTVQRKQFGRTGEMCGSAHSS